MKSVNQLFSTLALICFFSLNGFTQAFLQDHTAFIKTNILITKEFQQWMLAVETKTEKINQSNSFSVGYNYLTYVNLVDKDEGQYLAYHRVFTMKQLFTIVGK